MVVFLSDCIIKVHGALIDTNYSGETAGIIQLIDHPIFMILSIYLLAECFGGQVSAPWANSPDK